MNLFTKTLTFVPRKIYSYAKSINTALEAPAGISKKFTEFEKFITKLFGGTTGGVGAGRGIADAAEAYACQDGVCFVVSVIGVAADGFQMIACWVPGPNITILLTMPISWGCKTFVHACKNKTLPWKGGC